MPLSPQMSPKSFSPTFTCRFRFNSSPFVFEPIFFDILATSQVFSDYSMSVNSSPITSVEEVNPLNKDEKISNLYMKMPEAAHYVLNPPVRLQDNTSVYAETTDSLCDLSQIYQGRHSPPPFNSILAEARNERRYRLLLEHQFHPSRKSSINKSHWSTIFNQVGILSSYVATLEPSQCTAWRRWLPF